MTPKPCVFELQPKLG